MREDILHRMKNIAQIMMCLQSSIDKLYEEVEHGVVNNSADDCIRNAGWTVPKGSETMGYTNSVDNPSLEKEEV